MSDRCVAEYKTYNGLITSIHKAAWFRAALYPGVLSRSMLICDIFVSWGR
jgi:hypothetical protein